MPSPSNVRAPASPGGAEEGGVERVVDEVGDEVLGVQHRRVERQAVGTEPDGRGVDDQLGGLSSAAASSPAGRAVSGARATTSAILPARPVEHDDRGGAGVVEGGDDAARRRPGTEHGDVHPADVDAVGVEGGDEALPVGAVADEPPVALGDHRVDRAQRRRRRRQPVDAGGNLLLVRRRHRQPGDAERAHRRQRFVGASGRHVEGDVAPVDAGGIEGRLMDDRRQRVPDRRPDQRGDVHT